MEVRDIMNINVIRILSGATMAEAAELAAMTNYSVLFVVDNENNFIGVLSTSDISCPTSPRLWPAMAASWIPRRSLVKRGPSWSVSALTITSSKT